MAKSSTFEPCWWVVRESFLKERKKGRVFRIDVRNMHYFEGTSWAAFFRAGKNRYKNAERLYTYSPESEHDQFYERMDIWQKNKITVKTLAELFKLIGYDRLTKKLS